MSYLLTKGESASSKTEEMSSSEHQDSEPGSPATSERRKHLLLASVLILAGVASVLYPRGGDIDWQWDPWLGSPGNPIAISHQGDPVDPSRPDLAGFERAVTKFGYRYIESDIRLIDREPNPSTNGSSNRVLVAVHDIDGSIASLAELTAAGHDVATVEELLTNPTFTDVRWNFELKGGTLETATELARLIDKSNAQGRVCVSFGDIRNQQLVGDIRDALAGGCSCASFPEKSALFDFPSLVRLTAPFRKTTGHPISCVQLLHQFITQADVDEAHDRGIAIHAWEVNIPDKVFGQYLPDAVVDAERMSEQRMIDLLKMGVDGIITDDPALLSKVLANPDDWQD